jgi:acyl carrier protein
MIQDPTTFLVRPQTTMDSFDGVSIGMEIKERLRIKNVYLA